MGEQTPLPRRTAMAAVARSCVLTAGMLVRRRIRQPTGRVGTLLHFADGTSARVYRETVIEVDQVHEPCVLAVSFRLRGVRGAGHRLFRWESLLNTPLFAGFPGLVSKLWLANDQNETYRGLYQWDGATRAESYARALWWVLALVSVPGSIHYQVRSERTLEDELKQPPPPGASEWWQVEARF